MKQAKAFVSNVLSEPITMKLVWRNVRIVHWVFGKKKLILMKLLILRMQTIFLFLDI
jgi:hypothetical protein